MWVYTAKNLQHNEALGNTLTDLKLVWPRVPLNHNGRYDLTLHSAEHLLP